MRIGYARVSTTEQNLDLQKDAFKQAGCEKIIEDTASGKQTQRSGLDRARDLLRPGDTLVVWRLDRLGRSLKHLIELITELESQGIGFQSITEAIDTTSPGGTLVFHIFGAFAEFERNLIRERTRAGLEAARRGAGRAGGGTSWMPVSVLWPSSSTEVSSIPSWKSVIWSVLPSRRCTHMLRLPMLLAASYVLAWRSVRSCRLYRYTPL